MAPLESATAMIRENLHLLQSQLGLCGIPDMGKVDEGIATIFLHNHVHLVSPIWCKNPFHIALVSTSWNLSQIEDSVGLGFSLSSREVLGLLQVGNWSARRALVLGHASRLRQLAMSFSFTCHAMRFLSSSNSQ